MLLIFQMAVNTARFALIIDALDDLKDSLTDIGDETYWAGSALDYAIFVEQGTDAPSESGDGNFVERIREWAQDKAIPAGAAIHTILEEGTEPHPYRRPAVEKLRNRFSDFVIDVQHGGNVTRIEVDPQAFIGDDDERPIVEMGEFLTKEMRQSFDSGGIGAGTPPNTDSGALKASITHADTIERLVQKSRGAV